MSDNKRMSSVEVLTMLKQGYGKNTQYAEIISHNEHARSQADAILKQKIAEDSASSMQLLCAGYQQTLEVERDAAAKAKNEAAKAKSLTQDDKDAKADALFQEISKMMNEMDLLTNDAGVK